MPDLSQLQIVKNTILDYLPCAFYWSAAKRTDLVGSGPVDPTGHQQRNFDHYMAMDTDEKVFMLRQLRD